MDNEMVRAMLATPILQTAGEAVLVEAAAKSSWINLRAGKRVHAEGKRADGVYVLVRGGLRVQLAGPNDETLLARLFAAPAFLGEADVLSRIPWMESLVTVVDSRLIFIPTVPFEAMLVASPTLTLALLRDVSRRLMLTSELARQLAFGDVTSRVSRYLLDYAEIFGEPGPDGVTIAADMSQRSIAEELTLSRRVVQETITTMVRDGLLAKQAKHMVVRDIDGLRRLAEPFVKAIGHRQSPA